MHDKTLELLTVEECFNHLANDSLGRIAFTTASGHPAVFPVNYRFALHDGAAWIVMRTRAHNVIDEAPEQVSFQIDGVDPFHRRGWSVLAFGTLVHLNDETSRAMRELVDPSPWLGEERDAWLAVKITSTSGRRLADTGQYWGFNVHAYL